MKVGNRFTAVGAVVDHQSEAALIEALILGDLRGSQQQVAEHGLIFVGGFGDPWDGLARHHQVVDRCLRRDVLEADAVVVLVQDLGGDLLVADFLEQCLFSHGDGVNLTRAANSGKRGIVRGEFGLQWKSWEGAEVVCSDPGSGSNEVT